MDPVPRTIGYARVSSTDQETALQTAALRAEKCAYLFEEKFTGTTVDRPALQAALANLRPGDTFLVWKIDRLGRSMIDSATIVRDLERRGVHFRSITDNFDSSTPQGRMFLQILMAFAEYEHAMILERVNAGLKAARARGVFGGSRRKLTGHKLERVREAFRDPPISPATGKPMTHGELAKMMGVSRSTVLRWARPDYFERGGKDAERFRKRHGEHFDEWLVKSNEPGYGNNPRRHHNPA